MTEILYDDLLEHDARRSPDWLWQPAVDLDATPERSHDVDPDLHAAFTVAPEAVASDPLDCCGSSASGVFDSLPSWPDLDRILCERSFKVIALKGLSGWTLDGGILGVDGRPSFGAPSSIAFKTIAEIVARVGCFLYTDETGAEWAVRITADLPRSQGHWSGVAISCRFGLWALVGRLRAVYLNHLAERLAKLAHPGKVSKPSALRLRTRLRRLHRRLAALDAGLAILTSIVPPNGLSMNCDAGGLATVLWGSDRTTWPEGWTSVVFEAASSLTTLEVQRIEIPKVGWCPRSTARQPACLEVTYESAEILSVQWSPLFNHFLRRSSLDARVARCTNRAVSSSAATPEVNIDGSR